MRSPSPPRELSRAAFVSELDTLIAIYAAAMQAGPEQLPGRRSIMEQHAGHPGFRALAVAVDDCGAGGGPGAGGGLDEAERTYGPAQPGGAHGPGEAGSPGRIIAFGYGFSGAPGQWWHDVVAAALTAKSGAATAAAWLADSLEIAEVHVHPDFHRRGIGRSLVRGLAEGRPERTAVLSTQDTDSPARRLYRSLGFTDLLTGYSFPGSAIPYAVMGVVLPLRPAAAPATPGPDWLTGPGGPAHRVPAAGRSPGWPGNR